MKRFQLLQLLLVHELQLMDSTLSRSTNNSGSTSTNEGEGSSRRAQILQLFAAVEKEINERMERQDIDVMQAEEEDNADDRAAERKEAFLLQQLARDFSGSDWQVAAWRVFRNKVFAQAAATGRCAHCGV